MSACYSTDAMEGAAKPKRQILLVGVTGTTGIRAIRGLLDVGYVPSELKVMTRNESKPAIVELKRLGFGIVQADLENQSTLGDACQGCSGCYIHSTSRDTHDLDLKEVEKAQNLCEAIQKSGIDEIVYNSAAGANDHGVARIEQKHRVEQVFQTAIENGAHFRFTSLRATLFMEELWKRYTRPQILAGKYPLPAHRRKKIYLVSVRDLGRLAGTILYESKVDDHPSVTIINVAGDHLTGPEIARAFAESQQSPCRYFNPRLFTLIAWWKNKSLYEQIRFLQTSKETVDIDALRKRFTATPLTTFDRFLEETSWSNRTRVFEHFASPTSLDEWYLECEGSDLPLP